MPVSSVVLNALAWVGVGVGALTVIRAGVGVAVALGDELEYWWRRRR